MANKRFIDLPAASGLTGTEIIPAIQASGDVKTTAQAIANLVSFPYKILRAKVSQSGNGADPILTIMENTLSGTPVLTNTFGSSEFYTITLAGAFPIAKIYIAGCSAAGFTKNTGFPIYLNSSSFLATYMVSRLDDNSVIIRFRDAFDGAMTMNDALGPGHELYLPDILVYN